MPRRTGRNTGTIANGASLSGAIATNGLPVVAIEAPTFTSAAITLEGSVDGTNFFPIHDASGEKTFNAAATAARIIQINPPLVGLQQVKIRSGTSGAAVNQGADRTVAIYVADLT